ncbi:hypothetical protein BDZ85DRAFT_116780 [Elsinoe ampelina]|uniref:Uncharacterized protein n=1 Tax=Elsinoe ampelina TaxID=302913 RepID=A0A6A6FY31_9PEZI|nr:hypothetical protein BDZ85DRAFT_116780 [Elsinoe ampelina]
MSSTTEQPSAQRTAPPELSTSAAFVTCLVLLFFSIVFGLIISTYIAAVLWLFSDAIQFKYPDIWLDTLQFATTLWAFFAGCTMLMIVASGVTLNAVASAVKEEEAQPLTARQAAATAPPAAATAPRQAASADSAV